MNKNAKEKLVRRLESIRYRLERDSTLGCLHQGAPLKRCFLCTMRYINDINIRFFKTLSSVLAF